MAKKVATARKMKLQQETTSLSQTANNKQQAFKNTDTRCFKIQTGDMGPPPPPAGPLQLPRRSHSTYLSLLGSNLSQSQLSYKFVKDLKFYTYNTPSYYLSCLAVRANICRSPVRNALNMHSLS